MVNYEKLKTNLKITIQRLRLLVKKKTENSTKSAKEIADYLLASKLYILLYIYFNSFIF